jgi:hypothetical protein
LPPKKRTKGVGYGGGVGVLLFLRGAISRVFAPLYQRLLRIRANPAVEQTTTENVAESARLSTSLHYARDRDNSTQKQQHELCN